jgi:hypothetical protein
MSGMYGFLLLHFHVVLVKDPGFEFRSYMYIYACKILKYNLFCKVSVSFPLYLFVAGMKLNLTLGWSIFGKLLETFSVYH